MQYIYFSIRTALLLLLGYVFACLSMYMFSRASFRPNTITNARIFKNSGMVFGRVSHSMVPDDGVCVAKHAFVRYFHRNQINIRE